MPDLKDFSLQDGDEMERQDRVPHAEEVSSYPAFHVSVGSPRTMLFRIKALQMR
jgi:hypothetical protein